MSQNVTNFEWNAQRYKAAQLLAEGRLTDEEIAEELSVTRRTLARWKTQIAFIDYIYECIRTTRDELLKRGVRERQNRIDQIDNIVGKINRVINARATHYEEDEKAKAQGADTGLIVRKYKVIGTGENSREVEEYEVDVATLRELREQLKQAAIEVGEWAEKRLFGSADAQLATAEMSALIAKAYGDDDDQEDEPEPIEPNVEGTIKKPSAKKRAGKSARKTRKASTSRGRRPKATK
jgi:hypothetical protein